MVEHRVTRRTAVVAAASAFAASAVAPDARAASDPIVQPGERTPQAFMARAFAMRRLAESQGDQPFGAVVVIDGLIVGERPSAVVTARDATAHAEMEAIRDASRRLGRASLAGAVLYSSSRPCPMCEAAAAWAGVARMVHGEGATDAGAPRVWR